MKKFTFRLNSARFVSFLVFAFVFTFAFAQNPYTIVFQDEVLPMPENINTFEWNQMPDSAFYRDGVYGWIQFYETPNQATQDLFKANGLELISYIPHQTYLFRFPQNTSISFLHNNGVRSIVPVEARFKMHQNLKNGMIGDWAVQGDSYLVTLQYYEEADAPQVISELAAYGVAVKERHDVINVIDVVVPNNAVETIASLPFVKWMEVIVAPSTPDSDEGRNIHRANLLDTGIPGGRNYTGDGVGVMCRDDGAVGPHIDFTGRHISGNGDNGGSNTHGDGVSGIMAGSGNINPRYRGMAVGADLHVVFYVPQFTDSNTIDRLADGSVQVTNSSFSNGCNTGYTTITQTVDNQMNQFPNAIHVFSAGNSNGLDCGYGAGNQWGNITGGHKQGKNVIATANLFRDGSLVSSSSRGPAHDGRIKPEISAHGQGQISTNRNNSYQNFGGTSAAAPGIAGVTAQLFEVYMDANSGAMPEAALVKAALLNTANDLGNVGPDFRYGFGLVNALRAAVLLEDARYLNDNVSQGNSNVHTINIPSGAVEARFMVYWADPAASPGASPALVNDLDMEVTDPSSNTILPYVLDPTPNPANLNAPATNGVDRLNNMEQVVITNPAAGNYDIEITGFNVPQGPQDYWVVYEVITENLTVTYPNGGEKLRNTGPQEIIHWDAYGLTGDIEIEYSNDNGATWSTVATVPANALVYEWDTPNDDVTSQALVRLTSGAFSDTSDSTFSVAGIVSSVTITEVCENTASFLWLAVDGAEEYDLYMLGDKYMEVVGTTTETTITVDVDNMEDDIWYAVVARNNTEGWETLRSTARLYDEGESCALGVDDLSLDAIAMYPNPASDRVFVSMSTGSFNEYTIEITNSLGQSIQTIGGSADGNEMSFDVSTMQTGLYFVTITADGQTTTKKLLVK
jgi:hypothetical protein